jgi:hypothetical protein
LPYYELTEFKMKIKNKMRGAKKAPKGPVGSDMAFKPSPNTSHTTPPYLALEPEIRNSKPFPT